MVIRVKVDSVRSGLKFIELEDGEMFQFIENEDFTDEVNQKLDGLHYVCWIDGENSPELFKLATNKTKSLVYRISRVKITIG